MPTISPDIAKEAFAQAKFGQREMPNTPATPAERLAVKMREAANKKKEAAAAPQLSPLEIARRDAAVIDHRTAQESLDQVFDFGSSTGLSSETIETKGRDGVDRDGAKRKDQAQSGVALLEKFLDGYSSLSTLEREEVNAQIEEAIRGDFGGREYLDKVLNRGTLTRTRKPYLDAFLQDWANDPDFRDYVREIGRDTIENTPAEVLQNGVSAAESQAKTAKNAFNRENGEYDKKFDENASKQEEVSLKLNEFEPEVKDQAGVVITPGGPKWVQIQGYEGDMTTSKPAYDTLISDLNQMIVPYGAAFRDGNFIYSNAQRKALEKAGVFSGAIDKIREIHASPYIQAKTAREQLTEERVGLLRESKVLEDERDQLIASLARTAEEAGNAEDAVSNALRAKAKAEQEYADRVSNVFQEAMKKRLDEEGAYMDADVTTRLTEEADVEGDPFKKGLKEAKATYWGGTVFKDGKIVSELNKEAIRDGLNLLVEGDRLGIIEALGIVNPDTGEVYTQQDLDNHPDPESIYASVGTGPEAVLKQLMFSRINPATNDYYTLSEINNEIASDPEYYENEQKAVAFELIKKGFASRVMNSEVYDQIQSSNWADSNFLTAAFNDPEVQKALEEAKNQRPWFKHITIDQIKKRPYLGWGALMLMFMPGLSVVAVPAGGMFAGYKMLRSFGKRH